ncbi:MAG: AbrB/MazE/SpoVT family DNA-binding domain-containing protein [Nitrososphaerota archaeon]|nr:AbrB/MazE/SpoVT family DNA-binding domain-containing protein [Nitrososphaerota archaeon]
MELDKRHRVTLPKEVRKRFRMVEGQKFFLVPYGDDLIMKPVPKDPSKEMSKIIGDFQFSKKDRKKAEKWLLQETAHRKR